MDKRTGNSLVRTLIGLVVAMTLIACAVAVLMHDPTARRGTGLGTEFAYDIEQQRKTDPKLIWYGEDASAAVRPGFAALRGIAVGPEDRLYAAGDKAVRVFDGQGRRQAEMALPGEPQCLAVAGDGTTYVGLTDHVEVFDPGGAPGRAWESLGPKAIITSIAVAGGDVFIADAGSHAVLRCDASGKVLARIGETTPDGKRPGFVLPSPHFDLAVGPDGTLWAVDPGRANVRGYALDGTFRSAWGRPGQDIEGFCGCCNPGDIAILPDGSFATSEKGLVRVKVYDPAGNFVCVVAGPEQFAPEAAGLDLAVDSRGRILVLDRPARTVRSFVRKQAGATEPTSAPGVQ